MSSLANRLRAYVDAHLLLGSPAGRELLDIADRIDALAVAASPVTGLNDDPPPEKP
jgi:nucleotide-binding universal stress UspA family protein